MAEATVGEGDGCQEAIAPQSLENGITSWTTFTRETAIAFGKSLEKASWEGGLKALLPLEDIMKVFDQASKLLKAEPTLVELKPEEGTSVTVVGDTHGQLHDVLHMLEKTGYPSDTSHYVINGDEVDRGAWGLEVLLVFLAWKIAFPKSVTLLRGNHETVTCSSLYGFKGEVEQKYGKPQGKAVYDLCKRMFACLPLAARIGPHTLVLHGGLFRKPPAPVAGKNKRKRRPPSKECQMGSLQDLRGSGKGGLDPNGRGSTVVATDVLWSDPVAIPGLHLNVSRGVGVVFGPDVTQAFLEANELKLILRSHEGPDARFERDDMPDMQQGWTTDHQVAAGSLLTVFSAPDYPQFQADEEARYRNLAAVAVLRGPDWCKPEMVQYAAVLPRPPATASYDYMDIPGSDEEIDIAGSDNSQASSLSSLSDLEDSAGHFGAEPDKEVSPAVLEPAAPEKVDARKLRRQSREEKMGGFAASTATAAAAPPPPEPIKAATAAGQAPEVHAALAVPEQVAHPTLDPTSVPPSVPMDIDPPEPQAPPPDPTASDAPPSSVPADLAPTPPMQATPPGNRDRIGLATPVETHHSQLDLPEANVREHGGGGNGDPAAAAQQTPLSSTGGTPGGDTPLDGSNGPATSSMDEAVTPQAQPIVAPPQIHTGRARELEQAAAHALAVDGGVGQDTPETVSQCKANGSETPQESEAKLGSGAAVETPDADEPAVQEGARGKEEAVKKPAKPPSRLSNGSKAPAPWR